MGEPGSGRTKCDGSPLVGLETRALHPDLYTTFIGGLESSAAASPFPIDSCVHHPLY